jgi:DNA modification methylase
MSIVFGDCRTSMIDMIGRGERVQMCVTSPPYFGLRDYGHPGQLGLEQTPAEYVANMVEVFSLVWYLLADDGVLFLNLGDSYNSIGHKKSSSGYGTTGLAGGKAQEHTPLRRENNCPGLKHKDLIGIPWRVAFALQEAGWYLRQDIIWHKPNPMPESVTDRCTKAHEYMFLLTKSERYYFDNEAIKEPAVSTGFGGISNKATSKRAGSGLESEVNYEPDGTRNRRSVWTIATKPYKGAHFATFPPALIEPCILAGSRPGDVVFDPFMGSGTTAQVALQHGRRYLGCELNPEYEQLQKQRTGT